MAGFYAEIEIIKKIIDQEDPMGLLKMGAPDDEYFEEAKIVANKLKESPSFLLRGKFVRKVFLQQFDEKISLKVCNRIAVKIGFYLYYKEFLKEIEEDADLSCLKGKVSYEDGRIIFKIHEDFEVAWDRAQKMLINNKFCSVVEGQDLLWQLYDFVKKDNIIYVQYNKKHWWFFLFHFGKSYFKLIDKSKYDYNKLKNKQDVDLVFDNKKVLYKKQV